MIGVFWYRFSETALITPFLPWTHLACDLNGISDFRSPKERNSTVEKFSTSYLGSHVGSDCLRQQWMPCNCLQSLWHLPLPNGLLWFGGTLKHKELLAKIGIQLAQRAAHASISATTNQDSRQNYLDVVQVPQEAPGWGCPQTDSGEKGAKSNYTQEKSRVVSMSFCPSLSSVVLPYKPLYISATCNIFSAPCTCGPWTLEM